MYFNFTKHKKRNLLFAFSFFAIAFSGNLKAQLSGTKTIGVDYASIALAIADVNSLGVNGALIINIPAGYTETAPVGGFILTATGTGANTITFQKSGIGVNPLLTAYTGTATPGSANQDGVFRLVGSDFVTIDGIDITDPNAANPATMEFGYALYKANNNNGCQNNTITNCVVTLNRINNAASTAPMVEGSVGIIMMNATSLAATTVLVPTIATGSNSNNKFYSNTIQNCNYGMALIGYAAPSPFTLADTGNDIGGVSSLTGNTIINYGGGAVTSPAAAIRTLAQYNLNVSFNTINNNNGSGVNHATTLRGIYLNTATSANAAITNNTLTINSGATTSQVSVIENASGSTASSNTIAITNNVIQNCTYATSTTGVFNGILNSSSAGNVLINSNLFNNISLAGTGTCLLIETGSPSIATANNNTITAISRSGASGSFRLIKTTSPATSFTGSDNLIDGVIWTAAGSTGSVDGIYSLSSATAFTANNNIIRNISIPTTGTINGIREFGIAGIKTIQGNQIYNFSTTPGGVGGATFNGIFCSTGSIDISNNQVYSLNSSGTTGGTAGAINGIQISGGTLSNVYKNKVYNLSSTSTGPIVSGVLITGNTTNNFYNNLIGDLNSPFANSTNALIGINITGGTTNNIYYNTVQLNGISSGINFGSSAISTNATPTTIEIRNNIFVNNSTPNGTGISAAYRRSASALTNYATASNNNLFFAKTIFYDGTTTFTTLATFKAAVTPRESASFEENPNFASLTGSNANFLHFSTNTATFAESGAANITFFTDDFDNDIRQGNAGYVGLGTSPDIGADEFEGKIPTCFAPTGLTTSNITTTSVDLTWTAPISGTPASYNGEIRISGAPGSGTLGLVSGGTIPVPTTTASVPGLTALTAYSVYIQSDCGAGDLSSWSPVTTFTTLADCQVPTALNTTTVLATSANFTWTAGGTETAWDIYYGVQPLTIPTATTAPTATSSVASYSVTGLTQVTAYSLYIRANCGAGNSSVWTAVKNFTTPLSCPAPSTVTISGITPTTANATWLAGSSETSWFVKYMAPTTTVVTGAPTYSLTGLNPSTTYSIQVKGICAIGDSSTWTAFTTFTTPCLPPSILTTTPSARCGAGTTTLSATGDVGATLNWYANSTGGASVGTGTLFTTPTITTTTDFYVSAGNVFLGSKAVGNGALSGTGLSYNLTQGGYGGLKGQYLYTAAELANAGIAAGNITSLAFDLTAIGATLNGFAVEVGTTTLTTFASASQNIQGGLNTVYPAATFTPIVGINTINFSTPFNWDGTSNIIVSISWSNNNTSNTSSTIKYDATSNYASQTYRKDSETAANLFAFTGSTGAGTFSFGSSLNRPKFTFSGNVICASIRTAVTASVTAPPVLSVTSGSTICANAIQTLSVTSTLSDFDNYVWTPNTNLFTDGSATTAYTGNNQSILYYSSPLNNNTTYTLTANNTSNGCANNTTVSMGASMPVIYASATPTLLCSGSTVSLTANTSIIAAGSAAIGTGTLVTTGSNGSSGNYVSPYSHWYGGYKSQYTIRATELQAAGLAAGNITALSFSVISAGTTYTDFAISMAATTQSVATTAFNGSISQVYAPSNVTPTVGLNTYNFSTPFNWNGTSNIVVQICWSNNNGGGNAAEIVYSATSYASTSYYRVDNATSSAVCGQVTATGTINNRPNIILAGQTASQGAGTVTWQWNPGAINSNTANVNPINTGSTTTTESYTVTALDPATTCTNSAVVNFSVLPIPTVTATASSASVCAGSSATLTASGATNYTWTAAGTASTQVVTPGAASVYTVTGSTSGCSNTATVEVGVISNPTVIATASSASVCAGSSATLTASGATNYTWTAAGTASTQVVAPSSASVYTVTGEMSGCSNTATVEVGVNALPIVSISASNTLVCSNIGESSTLTASTSATSYTWSTTENTSVITVTPSVGTTYTLTVSDGTCEATATVFVDAQVCSGIKELVANGISVYPNPTNGIVNISISSELAGNTSIEVYDAIGKLTIKENLTSNTTTINTSKLVDGIYVYKIINNNTAIKIGKIVKQ